VPPASKSLNKPEFFSYSSSILHKNLEDLSLISREGLPLKNNYIIFNFKKLAKILVLILSTIIIRSICQSYFGAEETSLQKILLGLDYPFYKG